MVRTHSIVAALVSILSIGFQQQPTPSLVGPAVPLDPNSAIIEAFGLHAVVCVGDAHGDRQGEAFQIALIQDPRLAAVVQDVVIETGNSRYQDAVDRFVNGDAVAQEAIERVWLDTTQQQIASRSIPPVVIAIRRLNLTRPARQRLRVLVGESPIDWERMKTGDDLRTWEQQPEFDRDRFGADLIRREVLAKQRRALVLYGAGHFFRRPRSQSIVTLLEAGSTRTFTVWTNAAAELSGMQASVAGWPRPSLARLKGTVLGRVGMSEYLGPKAGEVSPEWLAPIEEQFDAILYLGPLATITLDRPAPWPCADPAFGELLRRLGLRSPAAADRARRTCKV